MRLAYRDSDLIVSINLAADLGQPDGGPGADPT
jgi:hypothetical protein